MAEILVIMALLLVAGLFLSATGTLSSTLQVAGLTITSSVERSAEGVIGQEVSLPAGKAGTLTTRTDDDTGVATLSEGHGIADSDYVDVYWAGGVRYGMDVTSVDGTAVSIDLGSGDNLPTQDSAIVVTARVEIDVDFDGDLVELIGVGSNKRAHVEFQESDGTEIMAQEIPAGEGWSWAADQGVANPLTGNPVGKVQASCGDSASAAALKIGVVYDSVS